MENAPLPSVYYGPDRLRVTPHNWAVQGETTPLFFGIAPLSWVAHSWKTPKTAAKIWHKHAAQLDMALQRTDDADKTFEDQISVLKKSKTLSFGASGKAAIGIAKRFARECIEPDATVSSVWCIKEGHVSSVWYTRLALPDGRLRSVAVNLARDAAAAKRLKRTAAVLQACKGEYVAEVQAAYDQPSSFALVQDWVPDAREVGVWRQSGQSVGLVAIERFLHDPETPARVSGVVAERLSKKHWRSLIATVAKLHRVSEAGIEIPGFDLSNGDFVTSPGGLRMIACDGEWQVLRGLPAGASISAIERVVEAQLKNAAMDCVSYSTAR